MTLVEIVALLGSIGTFSGIIIFFVQRNINNRALSVDILKGTKETEKIEQEIESKYALQVKKWIDDLQEIKEKHDLEIERKDTKIHHLQENRITLTADLTSALFKLAQCGRAHRRLFSALGIPYWECDKDGKLIYANGSWLKLFGLTMEEALGEGWLKSIPAEDQKSILLEWKARVVDQTDGELRFKVKNFLTDAIIHVKALYTTKFDTHSDVYKIIGVTVPTGENS